MNTLDSRVLGPLNCFVQKITQSGELKFEVRQSSAGFLPINEGLAGLIKVKPKKVSAAQMRTSGKQHYVPVAFSEGRLFAKSAPEEIEQCDAILFHQTDRKAPAFSVAGQIGETIFSSTELRDQAVFTHAFGLPGCYEWADANGSGLGGIIIVENDPATGKNAAKRATMRMSEGVLVHIVGDKVKPKELRISTGQTIFFAVEETKGITITDINLLKGENLAN